MWRIWRKSLAHTDQTPRVWTSRTKNKAQLTSGRWSRTLNVLISPRGTANLAGRSLGYQVYLIPRLLGLFLTRCKAIRPICRSASFAPLLPLRPPPGAPPTPPSPSSRPSAHPLSLSFLSAHPNLRLWLKLERPAGGIKGGRGDVGKARLHTVLRFLIIHTSTHTVSRW